MRRIFFLLLFIAFILLGLILTQDYSAPTDTIFYNGDIVTMDESNSSPEAIFVKGGKIEAVGSIDEINNFKTNKTKLVDLEGQTLIPGFIDIHTHPNLSAFTHSAVDLSGFTHNTPEEVWAELEKAVDNTEKGKWIFCQGFDPMLVPGLEAPHISFLNELVPDNPLFIISQSLHSVWSNSLGFETVGVDKNTPVPDIGSYYEKDSLGELTGFVAEQAAINPFKDALLGELDAKAVIVDVLEKYASNGNTSITTLGLTTTDKNSFLLYEHLGAEKSRMKYKLFELLKILPKRKPGVRHFLFVRHDTPDFLPDSPDFGDDSYRILGVKFWYDGSPYTGSMYLNDPYLNSEFNEVALKIPHNHHGEAIISEKELKEKFTKYHEAGWQIAIHSQGDRSSREVMSVFEDVVGNSERTDHRHRIEHGVLLPADLFPK